jgi:hypothetical protein
MPKITHTNLTQLSSNETSAVNAINANGALTEAAIENTLSRDGTAPNTMSAAIDMNSNKLLNVATGTADSDGVNLAQARTLSGPTGPQGPAGSGIFSTGDATVVPAVGDKFAFLDINDSNDPSYATLQTVHDGIALLPAAGELPAAGDLIAIADVSNTPDNAESVTVQFLFDGITSLTGLSAAPAIGDKFAVVDVSGTPDATKTVTMQEVLNGAHGLADATITASDKIVHIDVGSSNVAKTDTVQGILDLVPSSGIDITIGSETATTSGTAATIASIPAGTKMFMLLFQGVSFTSDVSMDITLGTAAGLVTSGYIGTSWNNGTYVSSTAAFETNSGSAGAGATSGIVTFILKNDSTNTWVCFGGAKQHTNGAWSIGGEKSLGVDTTGPTVDNRLTQISLSGGTFDAGSINLAILG